MNPSKREAASTSESAGNILARLDRLPITKTQYFWTVVLSLNLMLEYYDNAMFAYAIPTVAEHTGMSTDQVGMVTSAFFVGMFIGALVGGRLSDIWGRRTVFVWSTVLYSFGVLLTFFAPDYDLLLVSRLITGAGVQAATSILLVYIAEMFPSQMRGRIVSLVTIGFIISGVGAAALAMFYLPSSGPDTWRYLVLVGSVGLPVALVVRMTLPESVRWQVSRGHMAAARQTMERLEALTLKSRGFLPEPDVKAYRSSLQQATLRDLLRNKSVLRTVLIVSVGYFGSTLAYYLYINWGAYAMIYGLEYTEEQAYRALFFWNVAYIATPFLTYLFLDRMERKTAILSMSILSAVPLVLLGISSSNWIVISAGGAASIITGLVITAYYTYIPETIPTQMRALGSGIVMSVGRGGGIAAGVIGAMMFSFNGMTAVMGLAAVLYIVFAVPVMLWGPRTTRRSLETVEEEEIGGGVAPSEKGALA